MKKKISVLVEPLYCYTSARSVIEQLEYYIREYGEDNVTVDYDRRPYDDDYQHMICIQRLETDDEYEKRIAHDKWYKQQQEDKEKELFAHLKAKYES